MSGYEDERMYMGIDSQFMFPFVDSSFDTDIGGAFALPETAKKRASAAAELLTDNLSVSQELTVDMLPELTCILVNQQRNTADNMDTELSPRLSVDLNMFFDTQSPLYADANRVPVGFTPGVRSLFSEDDYSDKLTNGARAVFGAQSMNDASPESLGTLLAVQRSASLPSRTRAISLSERMENTYLQPHPDCYYGKQIATVPLAPSYLSENGCSLHHLSEQAKGHQSQSRETSIQSQTYMDVPDHQKKRSIAERRDTSSYRTSMADLDELLPHSTNTSFSPSVMSLHLNQPSFVSAQQYMRTLLELPAVVGRGSVEIYSRYGLSPDSLPQGKWPGLMPRSFTSYFPFMDKERKPSVALEPPEGNYGTLQPRTLMRSIFKGSDGTPELLLSSRTEELNIYSGIFEHSVVANDEDLLLPQAKPKRIKKGIFDRFKSTRLAETPVDDRAELGAFGLSNGEENVGVNGVTQSSGAPLAGTSQWSSELESGNKSVGSSLQPQHSAGLGALKALQPNYGALFKGMVKRRTLVGMKGTRKSQPLIKKEIMLKEAVLSKLSAAAADADNMSQEHDSLSALLKWVSGVSNDATNESEVSVPGALTSVSKCILGSRLLKRKGAWKRAPQAANVEGILEELGLPVNTEILEQASQKTRPRGRREDKEADLVDDAKIYICRYCSRRFKRQEHLKRHFRSLHTAEKPFDCTICQKKFSRTDNLNQHLKVHRSGSKEEWDDVKDELKQ